MEKTFFEYLPFDLIDLIFTHIENRDDLFNLNRAIGESKIGYHAELRAKEIFRKKFSGELVQNIEKIKKMFSYLSGYTWFQLLIDFAPATLYQLDYRSNILFVDIFGKNARRNKMLVDLHSLIQLNDEFPKKIQDLKLLIDYINQYYDEMVEEIIREFYNYLLNFETDHSIFDEYPDIAPIAKRLYEQDILGTNKLDKEIIHKLFLEPDLDFNLLMDEIPGANLAIPIFIYLIVRDNISKFTQDQQDIIRVKFFFRPYATKTKIEMDLEDDEFPVDGDAYNLDRAMRKLL